MTEESIMSKDHRVNVVHGRAAGKCLKEALTLRAGELLVNQDELSCGPLPTLHSLDEWRRIRESYLRTLDSDFTFDRLETDLLTNASSLSEAESITLWLGTGLADQLLLVWMPQLLRLLNMGPERLQVVQVSQVNGFEIQGVGLLNPDQIGNLPQAEVLDEMTIASLDAAWSAITAPDPSLLEEFLSQGAVPPPFLQRSLVYLLLRFPDAETGLNMLDLLLLQCVAEQGPDARRVIGYTIGRSIDSLDYVGDYYLFGRLSRLADPSLPHPLLSLIGSCDELQNARVHLTEAGRNVLDSRANFVEMNGIDDWVGGIHLDSSAGRVWFQQNAAFRAIIDAYSEPLAPTDMVQ
jgi:hypothetical protein